MTCDMWGVNILSNFQLPSSLVFYDILKIWRKRVTDSLNQLIRDLTEEMADLPF